jgi:hypothetical protein
MKGPAAARLASTDGNRASAIAYDRDFDGILEDGG